MHTVPCGLYGKWTHEVIRLRRNIGNGAETQRRAPPGIGTLTAMERQKAIKIPPAISAAGAVR